MILNLRSLEKLRMDGFGKDIKTVFAISSKICSIVLESVTEVYRIERGYFSFIKGNINR